MELCFNVRTFLALFKHQHDHHSEYAMVYSDEIEDKIDQIMLELKHCYPNLINYRWHALKLLEGDTPMQSCWSPAKKILNPVIYADWLLYYIVIANRRGIFPFGRCPRRLFSLYSSGPVL